MTEAIYEAGFNSGGRFYAASTDPGHDANRLSAPAARAPTIRFAVGECSLGAILVAQSAGACARFCSATIRMRWCGTFRIGSRGRRSRRRRGVRADRGQGGRLRRAAGGRGWICRWTSAARRSNSVSGRRCAGSRRGRRASYADIARRSARRRRARGGPGLRGQRAGRGHPLPSRGEAGRRLSGYRWGVERKRRCSRRRVRHERGSRRPRRGGRGCTASTGGRCRRRTRCPGLGVAARLLEAGSAARSPRMYGDERQVPQPRGDGAARLRPGRIQVLRLSAARRGRAAHASVCAARADRQSLERAHGRRGAVSGGARATSSRAATRPGRRVRRRCCCSTAPGDYNCLHQDLYGEHVFPFQVAFLLAEPGRGLHRRRVRADRAAPAHAVARRGRPAAARRRRGLRGPHRPVQGTRGDYRVNLRHGVSRLRSGRRHTLGIVFHDAR